MENNIGFVIQARSGSSRLPGKVLKPLVNEKGILEILIDMLQSYFPEFPLIVATSTEPGDDAIEALAQNMGVHVYRGSENNVAQRMYEAAVSKDLSGVIRICADNPMLNMQAINTLIKAYRESDQLDYLSFQTREGTPVIRSHFGLFVEIIRTDALKCILEETNNPFYLEHVTNYCYGHPEKFKVELINLPEAIAHRKDLRFTIDNAQDFELCRELLTDLGRETQDLNTLIEWVDDKKMNQRMLKEIRKYEK